MKYAILGCGYVAERHVRAAMQIPEAGVAVLCDINEEAARAQAKKCGVVCDIVRDYRQAIARDDVGIVVVCLPTPLHLEVCLAAAEKGKHIYMEKPLAQSTEEARQMIAACERAGVKMLMGHSMRCFPVIRRARQLVEEGHIGRLVKIRYTLCYYADYSKESRRWKVDASLPMHGALLDVGVHAADNIRFISGSRVVRLYAEGGAFRPEETSMVNSGVAVMRLENGAMAEWEVSEVQQTGGKFPLQHNCEVYGDKGSILVNPYGKLCLYSGLVSDPEKAYSEEEPKQDPFYQPWYDLHKEFVRCILEDRPVPIPPEVGFHALAVVESIFRSIRDHTVQIVPRL